MVLGPSELPHPFENAANSFAADIWRRLLTHAERIESVRALRKEGIAKAASMPMIATTIMISTSVNPLWCRECWTLLSVTKFIGEKDYCLPKTDQLSEIIQNISLHCHRDISILRVPWYGHGVHWGWVYLARLYHMVSQSTQRPCDVSSRGEICHLELTEGSQACSNAGDSSVSSE